MDQSISVFSMRFNLMGLRKPILTKIGMSSSMSEEAKFEQLA